MKSKMISIVSPKLRGASPERSPSACVSCRVAAAASWCWVLDARIPKWRGAVCPRCGGPASGRARAATSPRSLPVPCGGLGPGERACAASHPPPRALAEQQPSRELAKNCFGGSGRAGRSGLLSLEYIERSGWELGYLYPARGVSHALLDTSTSYLFRDNWCLLICGKHQLVPYRLLFVPCGPL